MMNEDELIAEMVNKAEALGYRKGFKQGLLRAAEICDRLSDGNAAGGMLSAGQVIASTTLAQAIRAEAEKEGK